MIQALKIFPYSVVPILMYHRISSTKPEEDTFMAAIAPKRFDEQMKYLSKRGFTTMTLDEFIIGHYNYKKTYDRRIVITFDDGYLDTYINAFPILLKYKFSATVFVVANFLGKMHTWHSCKPVPYMEWSHCREMSRYGISIQSHTCTHPDLTLLTNEAALAEIYESREKIEDFLGLPVRHLSYPYGKYDRRIMELVKKAGYSSGCTAGKSDRDRFSLERFCILPSYNIITFALKACMWSTWFRRFNITQWLSITKMDATD